MPAASIQFFATWAAAVQKRRHFGNCTPEQSRQTDRKLRKLFGKTHLGADLVAALTSLDVNDFPHFVFVLGF